MLNGKKTYESVGQVLFLLSWIPFIGIFSYVLYPIEEWLPPISIICMAISLSMMFVGIGLMFFASAQGAKVNRRVSANGIMSDATVLEVSDTGHRINDHFVLLVKLEVTPDHGPIFQACARQVIPIYHMAQLQPGNVLKVKYIQETQEVVIVF